MHQTRFDRISKSFAGRRRSQKQFVQPSLALGAAGLATGATVAQEATPAADATTGAERNPTVLFVQTYQSGAITPIEGVAGRYALTLEPGTGQTIYFSDRPDRIVGATEAPQFLEMLGFPTTTRRMPPWWSSRYRGRPTSRWWSCSAPATTRSRRASPTRSRSWRTGSMSLNRGKRGPEWTEHPAVDCSSKACEG